MKIAHEIYALYRDNSFYIGELKNLVREDNFRAGMSFYVAQYNPKLIQITGKLKIEPTEYLSRLTEKFSDDSSYLWKIEDFNEQIDKLYLEWQLIDALNLILSEPQKYFHNAQHELSTKLNRIKVPRIVAEKFQPNLKDIFQAFDSIKKNSVKDFEQAINQIKTFAAQFKEFFDNQFLTLPTLRGIYEKIELSRGQSLFSKAMPSCPYTVTRRLQLTFC